MGLYTPQVKTYLDTFGQNQVSILLYEDFLRDKQSFVTGILKFIGADSSFQLDLETAHNAYRMPRSQVVEKFRQSALWQGMRSYVPAFLKNSAKPLMDNTTKPDFSAEEPMLVELFREDVAQLAELLKRDLSFWLP